AGEFLTLLSEGEAFFAVPGNSTGAGQFFNEVMRLSTNPLLEPRHDELRDRCLIALAGKLREHAGIDDRPGTVVSQLLGETRVWEAPLVRDAEVALKAAQKQPNRPERSDKSSTLLHLCGSAITAARIAPSSGEVFAGFESGDVLGFRPSDSRVLKV